MSVQTVPYALQNASHSAALFRQATSAAFTTGGALGSNELLVTEQGSPNMSVILKPGRGKVVGTSVSPPAGQWWTTQAMYDVLNDADVTLTIAASNPTNPRIDLVYIQVQDSFYAGANNQAIAGVVTGTPAAVPVVPATPTNAIAIATVAVTAAATSIVNANIARVVGTATILGSAAAVADLTALAALTGMSTGDQVWVTEILASFAYTGTLWKQITVASISTSGARDTAYAKASGVYQVDGVQCRLSTGIVTQYNGTATAWVNWQSDWITWSTAPTGITIGTGGSASSLQRYKYVNGMLCFDYKFVLGSSGQSVGSNPVLNLPININMLTSGNALPFGDGGSIYDLSATGTLGYSKHLLLTITTVRLYYITVASPTYQQISSSAPMTWAAGDQIAGQFWCLAA